MRSSAWPTAGIASVAPLLALIALRLDGPRAAAISWWAISIVSLSLLIAGGLLTVRRVDLGRALSTAGLVGFLSSTLSTATLTPALALSALLVGLALLGTLWGLEVAQDSRLSRRQQRTLTERRARISSTIYLAEWLLAFLLQMEDRAVLACLGLGLLVALGFSLAWMLRTRRAGSRRWIGPTVVAGGSLAAAALVPWEPLQIAGLGALVPLTVLVAARPNEELSGSYWWQPIVEHPARLLVMTFAGLSFLGTLLLVLPASASDGRSVGFLDAAFTAVSAVCVTGLIVLDTPAAFGGFGEAVLLVLIQLGGLGIMSFSTVTLAFLGFRPSLRHEAAVAGIFGAERRGVLTEAVGRLLLFTFVVEAAGAVFLAGWLFHEGAPPQEAIWHGLFTAVSAFCNAGFALRSDSLVSFQQDSTVLHTVGALIIIGGLSPATVAAVPAILRRRRVAVDHKIAFVATLALLVLGTGTILALEWSHTLRQLSWPDRIHNAWFQSLTTRTAGFNSVDVAALRPATLTVVILLMFVGGSPGGTAGGIKTTTGVVLLLAVVSAVRGRFVATAFARRLSHRTVYEAASIVTVGVLSLLMGFFALQLTQNLDSRTALFETASALGTVGLSIGGTASLDAVGKIIIMVCMFAGRVGPLSLFLFLGSRRSESRWELVEEEVTVG
ncbi:MAG TPA: potassium transporter TrkG [Vicinamibacteria bacterium]|nr:potassium transporter TrkG [Vicinamibacteria bacterium]